MSALTQRRTARRQAYMVLSPRALPYAVCALESLLRNSCEPLHLRLITDSPADKVSLQVTLEGMNVAPGHTWCVYDETDLLEREAVLFADYPHLRGFRRGHPCWRKVTDPLLLSEPGEEMILLDPDLYFPNRFRFEETPAHGVLLMWQRPNCLFPAEVVRKAIDADVPLAHHVDIGVLHWRAPQMGDCSDMEWIDWLIGVLGGTDLPHVMHVEAIVWSAIAMRMGGGYLDPAAWHCWFRSQGKRLSRKMGASGLSILRSEPWFRMKCFHAGGEAKWFLPEAAEAGLLEPGPERVKATKVHPFEELTPGHFRREQGAKGMLRSMGYYKVFGASH